ncbi:MAG: phosphatidate cytidylyltransferase [Burkholderiales bacterium]|nr:phosphatidate cytidylyltransferase [Burkholderiales bacterium]
MLKTRVATAVVLAVLLLVALFALPPAGWLAFALAVGAAAAWEWAGLARAAASSRLAYAVATVAAAAALAVFAGLHEGAASAPLLVPVYGAAALFWLFGATAWLWRLPPAPSVALVLVLGWLVLIPTLLALVELRNAGPVLLLAIMVTVWIADIAAYFAGRAFGRRKLAPRVSPGKSWEGVAGAFAATTAYALAWRTFGPDFLPALPPVLAHPAGFVLFVWILTAASILGDLLESALKRQAGLKDSSGLLPGHGGVLDRIDALTPVLPLAALAVAR